MASSNNPFVWCDLMTRHAGPSVAFYSSVIGWQAEDANVPGRHYMVLSAGGTPMGGIGELPASAREAGARPGWSGYIGVDDVDAYVARVREAGGSLHREAEDIPGVGRFAVVADPQGAAFILFTPLQGGMAPPAGGKPGHVGWYELHAADREAAFAFYSSLFGWTKTDAIDLGPMGIYQTFAIGGSFGAGMIGGMMTKTESFPVPTWVYYFIVDDTGSAVSRVGSAGGQVLNGPHQVPGGLWVAQCLDPEGVLFAVVGPKASG